MSLSVTKRPAVANIKLTQSSINFRVAADSGKVPPTVADLQMTHKCLSKLLLTLSLNQGDLRLLQPTEIPQSVDPKVSPAQRILSLVISLDKKQPDIFGEGSELIFYTS